MKEASPAPAQLKLAIRCELTAQRGEWIRAVESLSAAAGEDSRLGNIDSAVWLLAKAAEILCAQCEPERAWKLFEDQVAPILSRATHDQQAAIRRNFHFVGVVLGRDASFLRYYEAVDQERDDRTEAIGLLAAEEASREQKHYESLPPLWRDLNRAYLAGDWTARRRAHSRLAVETFAAGWIGQAAYHSIHGENRDAAKRLAEWIIKQKDPAFANTTLRYALGSRLRLHIHTASELIGNLAEVITDDQISEVLEFLLDGVKDDHFTRNNEQAIIACWDNLRRLAFRYSDTEAARVCSRAICHPFSFNKCFGRLSVARAMHACVRRANRLDWVALTERCVVWASEEKWDYDYAEVLDLLQTIGTRDQAARDRIANAIAPSGAAVNDLHMMTRLAAFGRKTTAHQIQTLVARIAERIREQIWVGSGSPPAFGLSSFGNSARTTPDGRTERVEVQGGGLELDVLAAYCDLLDASMLRPLISCICELIENPLNLIVNRIRLWGFLRKIAGVLDAVLAEIVYDVVFPFASGGGAERSPVDQREDSTVSAFKMLGPTCADQRAVALITCAALMRAYPGIGAGFHSAVEAAMLAPEPVVRAMACKALREISLTNSQDEVSLVAALQDSDPGVCASAYDAVAELIKIGRLTELRPMIVAIAAKGARSDLPAVRHRVARLAVQLCASVSPGSLEPEIDPIIRLLRTDSHHSVRSALNDGPDIADGSVSAG